MGTCWLCCDICRMNRRNYDHKLVGAAWCKKIQEHVLERDCEFHKKMYHQAPVALPLVLEEFPTGEMEGAVYPEWWISETTPPYNRVLIRPDDIQGLLTKEQAKYLVDSVNVLQDLLDDLLLIQIGTDMFGPIEKYGGFGEYVKWVLEDAAKKVGWNNGGYFPEGGHAVV